MTVEQALGRFQTSSSVNARIFRAAAIVGFFSVTVKLVATAKELTVAACFGRGDAVDALLLAYAIPAFVVSIAAGSLNAALIPTYVQVRETEGEGAARQVFSGAVLCSFGILIALTILLAAVGPTLLAHIAPSFSRQKVQLTRHLFYALLPIVVLSGLSSNWSSILNAAGRFALPAVTPILTPLLSLLLIVTRAREWGIWSVAVGLVAGAAFEFGQLFGSVWACGLQPKLRWYGLTPALRQVLAQYAPLLGAGIMSSGTTVIDQSMAAWLQPGSVAALSYGNRIIGVLTGVTSMSLGTALIPYLSGMVAKEDWGGCRHTLTSYSRLVFTIAVPVSLFMVLGSTQIVRLLYQHGAFTASDTGVVASVQAMYALQIPFFAVGLLHVRLLTALRRNDIVMMCAGLCLVLDVVLNVFCMRLMGISGIALSSSLFFAVSSAFLTVATRRLLARAERPGMGVHGVDVGGEDRRAVLGESDGLCSRRSTNRRRARFSSAEAGSGVRQR